MRDREALRPFIDLDRLERDTATRNTANMSAADLFLLHRAFGAARYIAWFCRENI